MSARHGSSLRSALLLVAGTVGFFASVGVAASRSQAVASLWNRISPFANPGLQVCRRRYLLHAPHRLGVPGHQGKWHWEAKWGPVPLWHRRKFRFWQRFF